jgi:predicted nucleotidyltransferase
MPGILRFGQTESPLTELQNKLGCHWENIEEAREKSLSILEQLSTIIESKVSADSSVVLHGSLARQECTQSSDLDWTLLVDGQADSEDQRQLLEIKKNLTGSVQFQACGLKQPGREGTFGTLAFSQPMMHFIGGEEDSNSNTTRRVLLLLEALPVGKRRDAFDRVRKGILNRYIDEDRGLFHKNRDQSIRWVPLFLLNDFARYWRTMAVDFAYKQFDRGYDGYALRSIKLGISRKLLFASGLLTCFWCDPIVSANPDIQPNNQSLIDCTESFLVRTPLERIALFFCRHLSDANSGHLGETAKALFTAYDEFLGLLNDPKKRDHIQGLQPGETNNDSIYNDPVYREASAIRRKFGSSIQEMFFSDESPLRRHAIEKGVF